MKPSIKNLLLFRENYPRFDIIKKALRYKLEGKINRLTQIHASKRRQLAVFAFDYVTTQIILDGIYEIDELDLLTKWLSSLSCDDIFDGLALDVGANIGNHSLYFSDYFSEVLAFEPHPVTFKLLSINAGLASNVKCLNFGLSSSEGPAEMVIDGRNMSGARVEKNDHSLTSNIYLKTLDSALSATDGRPIRLIKIDVEGHETEVLVGAEDIIRKWQPIILFEQHESDFANGTTKSIELIRSFGYEEFACIEKLPRVPDRLPRLLRPLIALIMQILYGSSRQIVQMKMFQPKFYPFIVAIPAWLTSREVSGDNKF
jgi:FkbM family methyltransferase